MFLLEHPRVEGKGGVGAAGLPFAARGWEARREHRPGVLGCLDAWIPAWTPVYDSTDLEWGGSKSLTYARQRSSSMSETGQRRQRTHRLLHDLGRLRRPDYRKQRTGEGGAADEESPREPRRATESPGEPRTILTGF